MNQVVKMPEKDAKPVKVSKLKAVDPKAAEPSKPKILIFGKPGVGKTWTSLDFPTTYYMDTERGADLDHYTEKLKKAGGVYFGPDEGSLDFDSVISEIKTLATEDHPYKTLVIDSFSKLFNLEIALEAERLGDKNAFGADKKTAVGFTRRLTSWLTRLDMNVILICHEKALWGVDAKGNRSEIGVTFDAYDKLEYELHLCLNIVKQGNSRVARIRKSRLVGFPDGDSFPWSYADFASRYGKDVIERKSVQIVLATPEQLAEVKRLLEVVKVTDKEIEDGFKKAGVTCWEEMETQKIQTITNWLRSKVQ